MNEFNSLTRIICAIATYHMVPLPPPFLPPKLESEPTIPSFALAPELASFTDPSPSKPTPSIPGTMPNSPQFDIPMPTNLILELQDA
ncbi:hypothetical protein Ancab_005676 [Ancistrocladus abbreviatus]